MKVNYKNLATSGALALALAVGASSVTNAQGRRGRGGNQENHDQNSQRQAEREAQEASEDDGTQHGEGQYSHDGPVPFLISDPKNQAAPITTA